MTSDDIFTPTQVAKLLGASPVTVRQWAQKGLIEARMTAGGHRRYTRAAIVDFARRMAMVLPDEFAPTARPRVLVIDADRELNDGLVAWFKARFPGIDAAAAYDGFDAGYEAARFKPTLLLLDVSTPGLDGVAVCRRLTGDSPSMRVIATAAAASRDQATAVMAAGAERVLIKPFTPEELLEACGAIGMP